MTWKERIIPTIKGKSTDMLLLVPIQKENKISTALFIGIV